MTVLLAFLSFVVAAVFLAHHVIVGGVPKSISSLVNRMRWKWLWSLWLGVTGFLLLPLLLDELPETFKFVGFLMFIALLGTALTPVFVDKNRKAHNIFGNVLGVLSQVCVLILSPWWLVLWVGMLVVMILSLSGRIPKVFVGNGLFVIEVLCMITLYGALAL